MRLILVPFVLLAGTAVAHARCDTSGNCYTSSGSTGATTTYGANGSTGSSWTNQYDRSGAHGVDSRGNAWNYDRSSGQYYNYGTGESRYRGQRN